MIALLRPISKQNNFELSLPNGREFFQGAMAVGKSIKIWVLILTAVLLLPRLLLPGLAEDAIARTFEQELGV